VRFHLQPLPNEEQAMQSQRGVQRHAKADVAGVGSHGGHQNGQAGAAANVESSEVHQDARPRSLEIASEGIQTSGQFASLMSAIMSDVIEGRMTPGMANAAVNAGGKLLKIVELQLKYGTTNSPDQKKTFSLV
jgi:hypothetical protein